MSVTVIYPSRAHSAYKIAADEFARLSERVSGCSPQVITDDEFLAGDLHSSLAVVIGSDSVNSVLADLYLSKRTDSLGIKYGKDNYCIRCERIDGQLYLFLLIRHKPLHRKQ